MGRYSEKVAKSILEKIVKHFSSSPVMAYMFCTRIFPDRKRPNKDLYILKVGITFTLVISYGLISPCYTLK